MFIPQSTGNPRHQSRHCCPLRHRRRQNRPRRPHLPPAKHCPDKWKGTGTELVWLVWTQLKWVLSRRYTTQLVTHLEFDVQRLDRKSVDLEGTRNMVIHGYSPDFPLTNCGSPVLTHVIDSLKCKVGPTPRVQWQICQGCSYIAQLQRRNYGSWEPNGKARWALQVDNVGILGSEIGMPPNSNGSSSFSP